MNKTLPLILGFAAFTAVAQDQNGLPPAEPVPPPAPGSPKEAGPGQPAPPSEPAIPARPSAPRHKRTELKQAGIPSVMAQAAPALDGSNAKASAAVSLAAKNARALAVDADRWLPRSARTGRTLAVLSTDPDPSAIANAEEDLSVMALILRKATGGSHGEEKRFALGIEVDSTVFGSSSGARNIYLEGYGALFLLGVHFPLVAPPDKAEETKAKDSTSTDWQEAHEEYLNAGRGFFPEEVDRFFRGSSRQATEEYDADKVEELKSALFDALKNATHIRALKPEDYVTVVIQGAESVRPEKTSARAGAAGRAAAGSRSDSRRGETVMTVRVKKSDVDAFAKGALDLAGFRKKTAVQAYVRRGDSSVATSMFLSPLPGR